MSVAEKSIKLYAWKTNYQAFQVIQGEVDSRKFYIQLLNTSVPVNLTNCSVMLFAIKPDSTNVYVDCEVIDAENGIVTVTLTEQMCAVEGTVECWIQVAGEGGTDLRFEGMNIEVVPCSLSESIQSNDDLRAFLEQSAKLAAVEMEVQEARLGEPSLKDKQKSQDAQISGNSIRYDYRKDEIQIKDGSGAWHDWANGELVNHFLIKNGNLVSECNFTGTPETIQKEGEFGIGSTGTFMRFALNMIPYKGNYLKIVARRDYNGTDLGEPIGISRIDDYTNPSLVEGMHSISVVEEWSTFYLLIEDIFNETNPYLQLTFIDNVGYWIKTIAITSENGTEGSGEYDSSVELTQAEYDALPDTKLTDNKNYFIKDGKSGGSSSGYSETLLYENTDRTRALGTYNLSGSIRGYDMIAIEVNRNPTIQWNLEHCNYLQGSIVENLIGGSYVGNSGNDETNKAIWLLGPESSNGIISFPTEDTFKLDFTNSLWVKRIYGIKY